jgi:peptide chain release factor 2
MSAKVAQLVEHLTRNEKVGGPIPPFGSMKEENEKRIAEIESIMQSGDFWQDKIIAQKIVKELQELKELEANGGEGGKYDKGDAIVTIFSGAGGDDSEDFSRILLEMYLKYFRRQGWDVRTIHSNENDHGGYRNVTIEIHGKGVYGTIKHESGVHRLVRISPFNAKKLRHTSFSMVEVIPKFEKVDEFQIPEDEIEISMARSSGPGGQNVNKRETAVRMVHLPTKLSVHVESERSQAQNKDKAFEILGAKIYRYQEDERIAKEKGMYISKTTDAAWGNQIRSYVTHPYKMVKDHRTGVEVNNVDKIFGGELEEFIEAEKNL